MNMRGEYYVSSILLFLLLHKQLQFATLPTNIKEDSPQIDFVMSLLFYQPYSVTGAAGAVGALPFFPPRRR